MEDRLEQSVAVVILNWNGLQHLKTYLPSVLNTLSVDIGLPTMEL